MTRLFILLLAGLSTLAAISVSTDTPETSLSPKQVIAQPGWTDLGPVLREGPLEATLVGDGRFDFRFEPITIPIGETWKAAVVGNPTASIVRYELTQTTATETEFAVVFESIADHIVGELVVTTVFEGVETHRTTFAPAEVIQLGTVTSPTGAMGPTLHWVCIGGQCSWVFDPADTTIEFVDQPGVDVPFLYLKVQFTVDDPSLVDAAAVQFGM